MNSFGNMLKYLRLREHLTQRQLSGDLKISQSALALYESGKRTPNFETEELIADYFNVSLNTLRGIPEKDYSIDLTDNLIKDALTELSEEGKQKVLDYINDIKERYHK